MAQVDADLNNSPPRGKRTAPAWLISVVVHLVVLVVLGLTVRAIQPRPSEEPDRPTGIVLVHSDENQSVRYLSDGEPTEQNASPAQTGTPQPLTLLQPPVVLDVPLPGEVNVAALSNANDLVVVPNFAAYRRDPILPGVGDEAILAEDAARRKSKGPGGPPTTVRLFKGPSGTGRSFVFVIDRSKSMGNDGLGALSAAERELFVAVRGLQQHHTFQILAYHHTPMYVGSPRMLLATEENKATVSKFFGRIAAYGGTAHQTALLAALRLKPDVIFFLTDGGHPGLNEVQLDLIAQRAKRTAIHCIQFGFGPLQDEDNFIKKLARRNRGSYGYVDMNKR